MSTKNHIFDPSSYILIDEIWHNGAGAFYSSKNILTNQIFKSYLSKEPFPDNKENSLWTKTAESITNLEHPGLVKMIGYSKNESDHIQTPMIISEFVNGKTLKSYFNIKYNFSPTDMQILIFGIVSAMKALHKYGVVHKELTPDNIFIMDGFKPKIANFEESIVYSSFPLDHQFLYESLPYYAPESFKDGVFDEYTDIYSFGMILYQLFTKETPYSELKDLQSLKLKVPAGYRPNILVPLPFQFQRLIIRCCDPDPQRRPSFARLSDLLVTENYYVPECNVNIYNEFIKEISEIEMKNDICFASNNEFPSKTGEYDSNHEEDEEEDENFEVEESLKRIQDQLDEENLKLFKKGLDKDTNACYEIYKKLSKGSDGFPLSIDESIIFLKNAADLNDPKAIFKYASLLDKGNLIPKDEKLAAFYYKKSADKFQNTRSMIRYGEILLNNFSFLNEFQNDSAKNEIQISFNESIYELEKQETNNINHLEIAKGYFKIAMDSGDIDGKCRYANCIENENYDLACDMYQEAANQGNFLGLENYERTHEEPPFDSHLLLLFANSLENSDPTRASLIYQRVANFGDIEGEVGYAKMIEKGTTQLKKNPELAANFFLEAAKNGSPSGNYNYGRVLQYGIGVPKNIQLAFEYYKSGAELGNTDSMNSYAYFLEANISKRDQQESINEAGTYYKMSAEAGNTLGMVNFARFLELGCSNSIPKNINESARYYKLAADNGNSDGMFNYARMLQNGIGTPKNYCLAFKYFKKASKAGNVRAMNSTGFMLINGIGVNKSESEAVKYFKLGAKNGSPIAMNNYGEMLEAGRGTIKNALKALKYYIRGSQYKYPDAMYNYGRFLENGIGIEKNMEEALNLYKEAAQQNNPSAMYKYANLLELSCALNSNIQETNQQFESNSAENNKLINEYLQYYRKAADMKNINAMKRFAQILETNEYSKFGINQDTKKALLFYKLCADAGDVEIIEKFASINEENGNMVQALRYYKKGADLNSVYSISKYAQMLEEGKGTIQNIKKAQEFYKMAADMGNVTSMIKYAFLSENSGKFDDSFNYFKKAANTQNPIALYNCGRLIEMGFGTEKSMANAVSYYKKAAKLGNSDAMLQYAICLSKGNGVRKNLTSAYKYFKLAYNNGNTEAATELGIALKFGNGVPKDITKASELFKQGALNGDSLAMCNYAETLKLEGDYDEAKKYYKMACDLKQESAYYPLAKLLKEEDPNEYLYFCKLAADHGNVKAMKKFAKKTSDEKIKIEYLQLASNKNDFEAMFDLGQIFKLKGDKDSALNYFKICSEHNYVPSYSSYADLSDDVEIKLKYYKLSADIAKDTRSAYQYSLLMKNRRRSISGEYLKISADSGNLSAIIDYAGRLKEDSKIDESNKYYKIAADKGDLEAMLSYAQYAEFVKNDNDAIKYYKMAADLNDPFGQYKYGKILEKQKKYAQAMILFNKSAEQSNTDAIIEIGILYENGWGVSKSRDEALQKFQESAKLGNYNAYYHVGRLLEETGNKEEVLSNYKISAEGGCILGMKAYAKKLEENGDESRALHYYLLLSKKDDPHSMFKAGCFLIKHDNLDDKLKAIQLFNAGANLKDLDCMLKFGKLLSNGLPDNLLIKDQNKASKLIKYCVDQKMPAAMWEFSIMLENGYGVRQNKNESRKYLKKCAQANYEKGVLKYVEYLQTKSKLDKCIKYLNRLVSSNNCTETQKVQNLIAKITADMQNFEEAARLFKKNADNGDIEAMVNYAKMVSNGSGVPQNKNEAAYYYKLAADHGNVIGMLEFAKLSQNGFNGLDYEKQSPSTLPISSSNNELQSIKSDLQTANISLGRALSSGFIYLGNHEELAEAVHYYKLAADRGNSEAMYCYAKMCSRGIGVDQNLTEAFNYFMRGSNLSDYRAMRHAAKMLEDGRGTAQNSQEARRLYKIAAKKGQDPYSLYAFAFILESSHQYVRALKYYKSASERGVIDADVACGRMIEEGLGRKKSYEEAFAYFNYAADAGNAEALYRLGLLYETGSGVDKNLILANKCFNDAASKDHVEAILKAAKMSEKGRGTIKSKLVAMRLYQHAADLGCVKGMIKFALLRKKNDPSLANLTLAMNYLRTASSLGSVKAKNELQKIDKKIKKKGKLPPIPKPK